MKLRVMTYNIQHGRIHLVEPEQIDLSSAAGVIKDSGADIIGLNEVRGKGVSETYTAQTEKLGDLLGFNGFFGRSIYVGGRYDPYGNAVLSRFPIVEAKVYRIPDGIGDPGRHRESRTVTRAVIELPDLTRIAVYTSHFGLTEMEQEHAVSTVIELIRSEDLPYVLMGDFNMTPDHPLIRKLDEAACSTQTFLGDAKTHPSQAPDVRIDYIYTSPRVKVTNAQVIKKVVSDHLPVCADIEL